MNYEALDWYAVFAPAGTPEPLLARLFEACVDAVAKLRFQERRSQQGMLPFGGSRPELASYAAADRRRWTEFVRAARITAANRRRSKG